MHNKKSLIFFVALLVAVPAIQAKQSWPLIDFDEIERFFDQQFLDFNPRMRIQPSLIPVLNAPASIPCEPLTASIQETDEQVIIAIKKIETEDIDARLSDDNTQLSLSTPQGNIDILVENNYIQIEIRHEQPTYNGLGATFFSIGETVSGNPRLGEQIIDYDPSSGILTITMSKQTEEKKGRPVPISIKESDQDSSENEN